MSKKEVRIKESEIRIAAVNESLFGDLEAIERYNIREKDIQVLRELSQELQAICSKYVELIRTIKDKEIKDTFAYDYNLLHGVLYSINCTVRLHDMTVKPGS